MAMGEVSQILQGLAIGQQRQVANAKLAQEQQQESNLQTFRQQQIDDAKNALAEHGRQFDITAKAAKALFDLHRMEAEQKITAGIQQGMTVPGAKITNHRGDATGNFNTYQLPINDDSGNPMSVELPTPETYAQNQAKLTGIEQQPITDAKVAEAKAAAESKMQEILLGKKWDDARAKYHEEAENARNALTNQSRVTAASLRATSAANNGNPAFDPTPYIHGLADGSMSQEDVKRQQPSKVAASIFSGVLASGAKPLNQAQVDNVKELAGIVETIPKIDKFIANQPEHSTKAGAVFGGLGQALDPEQNRLWNEITGVIPAVARSATGVKNNRLNKPELDLTKGAFVPGLYTPKAANLRKRNDFVKLLNKLVDVGIDVPPAQRSLIKSKIGLDKIGLLPENGGGDGGNVSAAPTNTGVGTNDDVINGILDRHTK